MIANVSQELDGEVIGDLDGAEHNSVQHFVISTICEAIVIVVLITVIVLACRVSTFYLPQLWPIVFQSEYLIDSWMIIKAGVNK